MREVAAVERDRRPGARLERRHVRHLLRRHEVAPAHFGAIELELAGDAVEQALHREGAFRIAGAAHRHGGDLVGLDHQHLELVGGQDVGPGQRRGGIVGEVDPLRCIGALVVDEVAAHAEQPSRIVERDLEVPVLVALLHGGEEMLAPVLDPFDRPVQPQCGRGQHHLLRVHHELGAEAAADVGRHHAHLVLVAPQQRHQKGPHLVGELRRRPEGQTVLVDVIGRERATPFDRVRAAAVLLEVHAGAMGGTGKRTRHVAIGLLELDHHVATLAPERERRAGRDRGATVGDRRQRLVINGNQARRNGAWQRRSITSRCRRCRTAAHALAPGAPRAHGTARAIS